jgi:hypothetical protein
LHSRRTPARHNGLAVERSQGASARAANLSTRPIASCAMTGRGADDRGPTQATRRLNRPGFAGDLIP